MDFGVCRIDTFVLIPTWKFDKPSGNSKEVDEGFNGTHFVSPLSTPVLCLHTVKARIDSGMNGVGIQNSNTWTNIRPQTRPIKRYVQPMKLYVFRYPISTYSHVKNSIFSLDMVFFSISKIPSIPIHKSKLVLKKTVKCSEPICTYGHKIRGRKIIMAKEKIEFFTWE